MSAVVDANNSSGCENKVAQCESLLQHYRRTRQLSEQLAAPLSEADVQLQSMPDASPTKWHLAHTTWFFETFVLAVYEPDYRRFCEQYNYLFNSYYNGIGEQYQRSHRGLISRPNLAEVLDYRHRVDVAIEALLCSSPQALDDICAVVTLGIHHEQQHQELLLTDIKHAFSLNPLYPCYQSTDPIPDSPLVTLQQINFEEGLYAIGHEGNGFAFDNESPWHSVFLPAFALANRPVSNGEYIEFINSGAYQDPQYWLADGWAWVQSQTQSSQGLAAPLYWQQCDGEWWYYTLSGLQKVEWNAPVTHVNYYEAAAYALWAGARLPTEAEWEVAAQSIISDDLKEMVSSPGLLSDSYLRPRPAMPIASSKGAGLLQMIGDVWEWTSSSYSPYPGFVPFAGNAGEYNGKFMSNQYVLRGGSCATPPGHIRSTYRNFFYAHQAWQFTGIRLAYS